MNPALIIFGIQSVIRLGRVSNNALEQWARDGEAIFPEINKPDFNKLTFLSGFFNKPENKHYVVGPQSPYAEYWDNTAPKRDLTSQDALFTAATKIKAERGGDLSQTLAPAAAILVKQWDKKAGPVSPWAQIILTAGDIALDYVAANPSILGGNGNGEKLIAAYAKNLSELLPDDGQFGVKEGFVQRLTGVFLRAGLSTVNNNPQWVVSESHVTELINATVTPLLAVMPGDVTTQLIWQDVADTLMGPAASAALQTVAKHQTAFLGSDFAPDKAVGAVTRALFLNAAEDGLKDQFTKEGLLGLYTAALGVAAEQPKLFLGDGSKPEDQFAREMFTSLLGVLKTSPPPFDGEVGIALAGTALEVVGANAHRFAGASSPWEQAAADMVQSLTGHLSDALNTNGNIKNVFSKTQLTEFGRIVLTRVAETPRMVLSSKNEAWDGVIVAVASAMKADEKLLLTGDDWLQIASVAAAEAAANPGRLFKLDPNKPNNVLAGELLTVVLKAASKILLEPELSTRNVLYGNTLREAIIVILRSTSGNPQAVQERLSQIEELITKLNEFIASNQSHYGNKEWLRLFRILLSGVLEGQATPVLDLEQANELLKGAI